MKLIYIANARIPTEKAHGIQIMKMCEAFLKSKVPPVRRAGASQKLKVELLVPWRFNHIKKDPFEYYGIKKNFKIKKIFCIDLIPLDFILKNLAFWIQAVSFLISAKIYLMFKKYDILYTREQFTGLFFKNFVLEIHSLSKKNKPFHKKIWRRAKKLIVLTSFIKKELIKAGVSENKILVAPDGVDVREFDIEISKKEARQKLELPLDKKIILYTGHLYEWKGAQILAETPKFLPENTEIYFVGGTVKDVKKFKIQNGQTTPGLPKFKIQIIGHRPHSEIPYWLKAADILVLTGTKKSEKSRKYTSPMKMFEYMASKRPIIASDLPSFGEVLNDRNAVLVKPDNVKALAEGIKKVLSSSGIAKRISERAYKDVQEYTWDKRVEKILKFIK